MTGKEAGQKRIARTRTARLELHWRPDRRHAPAGSVTPPGGHDPELLARFARALRTREDYRLKLVSIDAETNGLRGHAFAVAAVATDDDGDEVGRLLVRCPIAGPVDPWVAENVLPAVKDMPLTHSSYPEMLDAIRGFLREHDDGYVVAHVAWPVEAQLLLDAFLPTDTGAPYPLIDVAGALLAHGHDPTSVDEYLKKQGIKVEDFGSRHHPLYDAVAAERCLRHLLLSRSVAGSVPDPRAETRNSTRTVING